MMLDLWAKRWGVGAEAVADLRREFNAIETDPASVTALSSSVAGSEAAVLARVRLAATVKGARLFRNNVGATKTDTGSFIRYGLCNDSPALNDMLKSSDLIGLRPVLIGPEHVGAVVGQFVAREIKAAGWRYTATEREVAQLKFLNLVASLGGDAAFAKDETTI